MQVGMFYQINTSYLKHLRSDSYPNWVIFIYYTLLTRLWHYRKRDNIYMHIVMEVLYGRNRPINITQDVRKPNVTPQYNNQESAFIYLLWHLTSWSHTDIFSKPLRLCSWNEKNIYSRWVALNNLSNLISLIL